jgi:hypothetical protein
MSSSAPELRELPRVPLATGARVTDDALVVELEDGRTLSVPLAWYPRLLHGTAAERAEWRLVGRGDGLHWPALDEDISVASLIAGRPSAESPRSLERWLAGRTHRGAA